MSKSSPLRTKHGEFNGSIKDNDDARFWTAQLAGSEAVQFPSLPSSTYQPHVDSCINHNFADLFLGAGNVSISTEIRAAWSILAGRYTDAKDVIFGATVAAQQAARPGGEIIPIVPVRISIDGEKFVNQLLQDVQSQSTEMVAYKSTDLERIRSISTELDRASRFQTLIVIQPWKSGIEDSTENGILKLAMDEECKGLGYLDTLKTHALVLVFRSAKDGLQLQAGFDSRVIEMDKVKRMVFQLEHILRQLCEPNLVRVMLVKDIETISPQDLCDVWSWNAVVPEAVENCVVHELISQTSRRRQNAPAVCAWNGELTYRELDRLSTKLALYLVTRGVHHQVIALFFEKSMWMPVAMLAGMKAGAVSLAIDVTQPVEYLRSIMARAGPTLILSSPANEMLAGQLCTDVVVISEHFDHLSAMSNAKLPLVQAADNLCVVFTSGSTGMSKGAVITHRNFGSALQLQQSVLGLNQKSRTFDFASYAFDLAWGNLLHTLYAGGCLCIPDEKSRHVNLAQSISSLGANHLITTPTVADLLRPSEVPGIHTLQLGGELLKPGRIFEWVPKVTVMNVYGPTECTVLCTFQNILQEQDVKIGTGVGAVTWICDPTNDSKLVPVGSIGELLLEGPLVGAGYIGDPEKTSASFIENPPWLLRGAPGRHGEPNIPGRQGRLYKTGDLMRYDPDGTLQFIARKDTQVKIRGQRLELGQVEHHVQNCLSERYRNVTVAAEAITPTDSSNSVLTVFVSLGDTDASIRDTRTALESIVREIDERLGDRLPTYMLPGAYIPIEAIPLTTNGKANRRRLREIGESLSMEQLIELNPMRDEYMAPSTEMELRLQELWALVLGISASSIGVDDSFVRLGGDSIVAIRLVAVARQHGLSLTVANVLKQPRLRNLARLLRPGVDSRSSKEVAPFSLLNKNIIGEKQARSQVAELCKVDDTLIEDLFPCTPMQEGLLALTAKRAGDYVVTYELELPANMELDHLKQAWEDVVATTPILRTRIVDLPTHGLVQVILRGSVDWIITADTEAFIQDTREQQWGLATPLTKFGVTNKHGQHGQDSLLLALHHSLCDGWSIPLIFEKLSKALQGEAPIPSPSFQDFVKHIVQVEQESCSKFWRENLEGSSATSPLSGLQKLHAPKANQLVEHRASLELSGSGVDFPLSTKLQLAWAYLLGMYAQSTDVTFGAVVTGRAAPVAGIEKMIGPTIAAVPVRYRMNMEDSVEQSLKKAQDLSIAMIPYEQAGLRRISSLGPDQAQACDFETLLIIQPQKAAISERAQIRVEQKSSDLRRFSSYPLVIECSLSDKGSGYRIVASFDDRIYKVRMVMRLLDQYEWITKQLCVHPHLPLSKIDRMCPSDLLQIEQWNRTAPKAIRRTLNSIISEVCVRQPNSLAIITSTTRTTYGELERFSSRLAVHLRASGVGREVFVPLSVDRSPISVIATLAILKAGGAVVNMDSTQPLKRRKVIVETVEAKLAVVCGETYDEELFDGVLTVRVNQTLLDGLPDTESETWNEDPQSAAFIIFTSGSTGRPKAMVHEHESLATSVLRHRQHLGFSNTTRMIQMASCAFDVWIHEHLDTLAAAGCLCIPSEEEKMNSLGAFARRMDTNTAITTPTSLREIEGPLSCLTNITVCGEPIATDIIDKFSESASLFNGYGPAETTFCSAAAVEPGKTVLGTIGKGLDCLYWVCDPEDSSKLVPIGAIGELLIQGPVVARGYINYPEATSAAFLDDIPWSYEIGSSSSGRIYKSGDLVRYNDDGSLVFISRKDTQVKLRGFRIELGEIEHHLRSHLDGKEVVAELVRVQSSERSQLVAFTTSQVPGSDVIKDNILLSPDYAISEAEEALQQLSYVLPPYMLPVAILPVQRIPRTASGKTDRKLLRKLVENIPQEALTAYSPSRTFEAVRTERERLLCALWAAVLGIEATSISRTDSFLRVGGDSIGAMRLVGVARKHGLSLTVADIFKQPRLQDLAKVVTRSDAMPKEGIVSLSLLNSSVALNDLLTNVAILGRVEAAQVEDIFPCTPLQEGLIALTAKRANDYVARSVFDLPNNVDLSQFQKACEHVFAELPILRTRIVDLPGQGLVQVVVNESVHWAYFSSLSSFLEYDKPESFTLGTPLCQFAIVKESETSKSLFAWTLHHALYDGWLMPLMLEMIEKAYLQKSWDPIAPFQLFVQHVAGIDKKSAAKYWKRQLSGSQALSFPILPTSSYQQRIDTYIKHHIVRLEWPRNDITASTAIRASWAVLAASYTDSLDVVFGASVTGRQAAVPGIERIAGPTVATVPVRIMIDKQENVEELLGKVQQQSIDMTEFEQVGLPWIWRINPDTERAGQFQTLLVIQPTKSNSKTTECKLLESRVIIDGSNAADRFNTYSLVLECLLEDKGMELGIGFDSKVIEKEQANRMAHRFEHVLRQICRQETTAKKVKDLEIISPQDLSDIWSWNASVPETVDACVHDLIAETTQRQPDAPAICAWDGELTYKKLDEYSTRLARYLVTQGVGRQVIVPLCFEKSMWMSVAMLAVMKTGGSSMAMDSSQPEEILRTIVAKVNAKLILSSAANKAFASRLANVSVVVADQENLEQLSDLPYPSLPRANPSDILYVVFTSGSTGTPKGVVITHRNFSSAIRHQSRALRFSAGARVFDWVSYAFDVSWVNVLPTLVAGGCLCVPSDEGRRNNIADSICKLRANIVHFTPSVARLIDPARVTCVKTLVLGGEVVTAEDSDRWAGVADVIHGYGPSECTPAVMVSNYNPTGPKISTIGRGVGCNTWIVEQDCANRLVAVGNVGELLIEGPIVGDGYFNDPEKTAEAFIEDPMWLTVGQPGDIGRPGRLYKTGDLVRYNPDGTLQFIGRKDSQVKIRGQRVELGDVEHHIRGCLQDGCNVVAEVLIPDGSNNPILVAFLSLDDVSNGAGDGSSAALRKMMRGIDEKLAEQVPVYMVPSVYIAIETIPTTATGKTDRRKLRETWSLPMEQLTQLNLSRVEHREPTTDMEKRLRKLWSSVLAINTSSIGVDDSFLLIGGDSIQAMRLVSAARKQGLSLTVADVFKMPRLGDLAKITAEESLQEDHNHVLPFALLQTNDVGAFLKKEVYPKLHQDAESIQDVFPTTDFQDLAIRDALCDPPGRWAHILVDLPPDVDLDRLEQACCRLVNHFEILRTVFVAAEKGFQQVVLASLRPRFNVFETTNEAESLTIKICEEDLKEKRLLGRTFIRFMVVKSLAGSVGLIFRLSSAQYDGICIHPILQSLASFYDQQNDLTRDIAFRQFIAYSESQKSRCVGYWTLKMKEAPKPTWQTKLPTDSTDSLSDRYQINCRLKMPDVHDEFSAATLFHAACALALSEYNGDPEVIFGRLVTGRSMLPLYLQDVAGPCLTELPVRVKIDGSETVTSLARRLQPQFVEESVYESIGMVEIIRECTNWPETINDFGWRTSFHPAAESSITFARSKCGFSPYQRDFLPRKRPEIYASPVGGELQVSCTCNKRLVSPHIVEEVFKLVQRFLKDG